MKTAESLNLEQVASSLRAAGIDEIVIVDSSLDRYEDFVLAAQAGETGLHFCVDGRSAIRLSRRFRADVWLVSSELSDMSGFDLLSMLAPHVMQGSVDPLLEGSAISLDRLGDAMRTGIFVVSDSYSVEEEQQALATGVAGYLVRPVTIDLIRNARTPRGRTATETTTAS